MRYLSILVIACLLSGCGTSYRRPILGMFGGFSEKKLGDAHYRVTFGTNGFSDRGFAVKGALYRSAELARQNGAPYFQIVNADLIVTRFVYGYVPSSYNGGMYGGETVTLVIRFAQTEDQPLQCDAADRRKCQTFKADDVLNELGPVVKPGRKRATG